MLEQIRGLEELRGLLAAAQASVTAAFVAGRRDEQAAVGVPARRVGLGIAQELGLARRESPARAGRYAGWSSILTAELPHTLAALRSGVTSEWRAMLVARETGWLSREDRAAVDADLGPRLGGLGDGQVEAEARRLAYRLDPHGTVERRARAARSRRVSLRPAPDGMSSLNAMLPLTQGVAVYAALNAAAASARAVGDGRSRGQVMADMLVERVTGQERAELVPLRVDLIITDQALTNTGPQAGEPATVSGWGPIPAPVARDLIARTATHAQTGSAEPGRTGGRPREVSGSEDGPTKTSARGHRSEAGRRDRSSGAAAAQGLVALRRLFTDPVGRLVSMETQGRFFTPAMGEFVRLRDQRCITPFCGALIRHIDHLMSVANGGLTSLTNAGGRCEACNQAKEAPGWTVTRMPDGSISVTMPTGHDTQAFTRSHAPGAEPLPEQPAAPPSVEPPAVPPPAPPSAAPLAESPAVPLPAPPRHVVTAPRSTVTRAPSTRTSRRRTTRKRRSPAARLSP